MNAKILLFLLVCGLIGQFGLTRAAHAATISKQQLIINVLPDFIKIYGNNPSEAEKSWWRERITCGELTTEDKLLASMQYTKDHKVRIGSPYICGKKPVASAKKTVSSTSGPSVIKKKIDGIDGNRDGDLVRIGITHTNGQPITVTADKNFQIREGADKVLATMKAGQNVSVSWSGGQYHVRGSGKKFDTDNKIRFVPLNGAIMQIVSYSDPSVTYPGKNYNRFRGTIEIRKCNTCSELWAINELRTELYLRGLGETSGEGPEQYIDALGIAARTYVLYHKIVTGGRSDKNDFDI
ncbi:MAG TPA: SpoIID/LytB domain-containing protein, partial [Candidatus Andersenbacteria bacterium]|nr:SpoIID/LytB domain-containing protein [Candidatus Andersenbacteria bacterium]